MQREATYDTLKQVQRHPGAPCFVDAVTQVLEADPCCVTLTMTAFTLTASSVSDGGTDAPTTNAHH
jgi:hypothetical protein